jgi:DUF2892 family protein
MKSNVGGIDKILRIALGVGLLASIFFIPGEARWWGLLGLVPLLTGVVGWCPIYPLLGLSTCPARPR